MKKRIRTSPRSHRDRQFLEERRFKAARLFKKGWTRADVARKFDVSRDAASRWYHDWQQGGIEALRSKGAPGPKPRLSDEQLDRIADALVEGPRAQGYATDFWTLSRIKALVRKTTRISYHESHIWRLLTYRLGFSCQKPTTRAKERDEAAIAHWKRYQWPQIKRGPSREAIA